MHVRFSLYSGFMFCLMKQYHPRLPEYPPNSKPFLENVNERTQLYIPRDFPVSRICSLKRSRKAHEFSPIAIGENGQSDSLEEEETG